MPIRKNTIISLEHVYLWPKIYVILYPSVGNLTTHLLQTTTNFFQKYSDGSY